MNDVGLKQNGRLYYGWVLMIVGFLIMSVAYTGCISITSVFVIPVTEAFGIERSSFLLYQTILTLTAVVVTAYFGKRMAKGNLKLIVVVSALIAAGGYVLFAMAKALYWFYIGSVLIGVGFSNCTVLSLSIVLNNWFGGKIRGTAMGVCWGSCNRTIVEFRNFEFRLEKWIFDFSSVVLWCSVNFAFIYCKNSGAKGLYQNGGNG